MIWKREAIEKLDQYEAKREALRLIPVEIRRLEAEAEGIHSASGQESPVSGCSGSREDRFLSNIVRREELERNFEQARAWVSLVDSALSLLSPDDREILTRFYIRGERGAANRLAGDLCCDVKTVYHRKDRALRKFTISLYGGTES